MDTSNEDMSVPHEESPESHSSSAVGRVIRLHFTCRAELPRGSFLRVTGSTLWAPGSSALDPTEATPTVQHLNHAEDDFPEDEHHRSSNLYTSSVEMVTTPDTYPIWKTRTPVILISNRRHASSSSSSSSNAVHHHYYRYLVVAPGGRPDCEVATAPTSTSNEASGSTIVMEWEDPFHTLSSPHDEVASHMSAVSLQSSVHLAAMAQSGNHYRNLPYRTIDVSHLRTTVAVEDLWNHPDDPSFQPYRIREAVRLLRFLFCCTVLRL